MKIGIEPVNDRMCILTRAKGDKADLIRFVLSPDGAVTPDLKHRLPGRGCWVTASRAAVDEAAKKGLFARAFKAKIAASENLGAAIDALLLADLTGMMNMARKSGQFIGGSGKADAAIRSGEAIALFHATDAAADGVRKLGQAVKARALTLDEMEIPVFRLMTGDQMDACFGEGGFIHATALAGQAGEGVVKRAMRLAAYRSADDR